MRASGSGAIGIILMLAPVCVIPVLAVVGIPQFAPILSTSQSDTTIAAEIPEEESPGIETDWGDSPHYEADHLLAPLDSDLNDSTTGDFSRSAGPESSGGHQQPGADIFGEFSAESDAADSTPRNDSMRDDRMVSASPWSPPPVALDGWEIEKPQTPDLFEKSKPGSERGAMSEASRRRLMESRSGFSREPFVGEKPAREKNPFAAEEFSDDPPPESSVDLFADISSPGSTRMDAEPAPSSPTPFAEEPAARPSRDARTPAFDQIDGREDAADDGESQQAILTWRAASQRLRALGVRQHDFHYDPNREQFLFRCELTPADNPAVTQTFESEAVEPLVAVQEVLDQIATWQRERPRRSGAIRAQNAAPSRFEW